MDNISNMKIIDSRTGEILQVRDAAELLFNNREKTKAVYNMVLRRQIPFRKPSGKNGRLFFLRSEIMSFIEKSPGLRPDEINK